MHLPDRPTALVSQERLESWLDQGLAALRWSLRLLRWAMVAALWVELALAIIMTIVAVSRSDRVGLVALAGWAVWLVASWYALRRDRAALLGLTSIADVHDQLMGAIDLGALQDSAVVAIVGTEGPQTLWGRAKNVLVALRLIGRTVSDVQSLPSIAPYMRSARTWTAIWNVAALVLGAALVIVLTVFSVHP